MRQIGVLPDEEHAILFATFLQTQGIESRVEGHNGTLTLWVYDEDRVAEAKQEYESFLSEPDNVRYREAAEHAVRTRLRGMKARREERAQVVNMRDRWSRRPQSDFPLTIALIVISVVVTWLISFSQNAEEVLGKLLFATSSPVSIWDRFRIPDDILSGEVWRLITPIFIHASLKGSAYHLVFNSIVTYQLGQIIEQREGTLRFLVLVLLLAVPSNFGQYIWSNHFFGGLSGVVYGLFGYVWMKSLTQPEDGYALNQSAVVMMLAWFFICFFISYIANGAHAAGLLMGIILGATPGLWKEFRASMRSA